MARISFTRSSRVSVTPTFSGCSERVPPWIPGSLNACSSGQAVRLSSPSAVMLSFSISALLRASLGRAQTGGGVLRAVRLEGLRFGAEAGGQPLGQVDQLTDAGGGVEFCGSGH